MRERMRSRSVRPRSPATAACLALTLLACMALAQSDVADPTCSGECEAEEPLATPEVVLLWPDEGRVFKNGSNIVAALVTARFDTPREGYIHLLLNGYPEANFTPHAQDTEGNRRLHIVLPPIADGGVSVEVQCRSPKGKLLAKAGATFFVQSNISLPSTKSSMIWEKPGSCHDVGFCDQRKDCNNHGECRNGACICDANWAGDTCDHDILNNPTYLPDIHPLESPSLCHKSASWENLSAMLLKELQSLHSLGHCSDESRVMWFAAPHHGLGGNMHILTVALTHALANSRAMGVVGSWTYGSHEGCNGASHGLACYYNDYASACPHLFVNEHSGEYLLLREEEPNWMWEDRNRLTGHGRNPSHVDNAADNPPYRYSQFGILWWRSHLLSFLMTPNLSLQRKIRQIKNFIGYRHPIIGVHIRHGDACIHGSLSSYRPPCKLVPEYFKQARGGRGGRG
uniref:EGF-like domain-containing protein n=1 Tax=Guillardia theta TaxID=55529 RepID=A0A7S4UFX5_GUITH|mmetsp:Transcript_47279/g.147814  ORF Transcript_47279/g.147814 Transcript_47279/m.147814 type:complete len:456 (+) Transcript_47279:27-1394(+)